LKGEPPPTSTLEVETAPADLYPPDSAVTMPKRVVLAMSGGVDSSVAAIFSRLVDMM